MWSAGFCTLQKKNKARSEVTLSFLLELTSALERELSSTLIIMETFGPGVFVRTHTPVDKVSKLCVNWLSGRWSTGGVCLMRNRREDLLLSWVFLCVFPLQTLSQQLLSENERERESQAVWRRQSHRWVCVCVSLRKGKRHTDGESQWEWERKRVKERTNQGWEWVRFIGKVRES